MHKSVKNLVDINNNIEATLRDLKINNEVKIVAVSKTFNIDKILPLIEHGHLHYGENKVQEAIDKWTDIKKENDRIKLHMIGKLQTNKVKLAVKLFDYIHSVESEKLAKKISDEANKINKKIKIFVQVNIGSENQKSGIDTDQLEKLLVLCKKIELDVIGLMCIPPINIDPSDYFSEMERLNNSFGFKELSHTSRFLPILLGTPTGTAPISSTHSESF